MLYEKLVSSRDERMMPTATISNFQNYIYFKTNDFGHQQQSKKKKKNPTHLNTVNCVFA